MNNEVKTLEKLISGGLIGATLGALLSKRKDEGALIGAIVGVAYFATLKASEEARNSNVSVIVEEDGYLYERKPNGEKRLIRQLNKPNNRVKAHFKLT